MPRKRLLRSKTLPYHVTARSNNRADFPVPLDRLWEITAEECLFLNWVYEAEFHAVVLMPNHYHLLLTVPSHDLGIVMNDFMRSISKRINLISGRKGHSFGGPYFRSLIRDTRYFGQALKYVYRNPVRGGLCERTEDYPYSTLRGLIGKAHLPFPLYWTRVGMEVALPKEGNSVDLLEWMNFPFPKQEELEVRKALRGPDFGSKGRAYPPRCHAIATRATNPISPMNER